MTTAADPSVDLDVDLTKSIPCEYGKPCDGAAAWAFRLVPCGHGRKMCDPHARFVREWTATEPNVICLTCNSQVQRVAWRQL